MTDRPSDAEIARYMQTKAYIKRVRRTQKELRRRMDAGEPWTFDWIARELRLPLNVVIGGFMHSMAKAGMPLTPIGRVH